MEAINYDLVGMVANLGFPIAISIYLQQPPNDPSVGFLKGWKIFYSSSGGGGYVGNTQCCPSRCGACG